MYVLLTDSGKKIIKNFIKECEAKRKEILDAGIDTAEDTILPNLEDILADIEWSCEPGDDYFNAWGVTDNRDLSIGLDYDIDFVFHI